MTVADRKACGLFDSTRDGNKDKQSQYVSIEKENWRRIFRQPENQFLKKWIGTGSRNENLWPSGLRIYHGEFDPGSERTLAARLKHASRTGSVACYRESGGLVSNT